MGSQRRLRESFTENTEVKVAGFVAYVQKRYSHWKPFWDFTGVSVAGGMQNCR